MCSDNAATLLKTSATFALCTHLVLLNFVAKYRRFLIDHGYKIILRLPVFSSESTGDAWKNTTEEGNMTREQKEIIPLRVEFYPKTDKEGRDAKLYILQSAVKLVFADLSKIAVKGLILSSQRKLWNRHTVAVSYCCDIPGCKDISGTKHRRTHLFCVRCLSAWDDNNALGLAKI